MIKRVAKPKYISKVSASTMVVIIGPAISAGSRCKSFANIGRALETGESLDEAQQHRDESERQGHNASHSEAITAAIGILTSGFCDTAPQVDDAERRRKKELEKKKRGIHR